MMIQLKPGVFCNVGVVFLKISLPYSWQQLEAIQTGRKRIALWSELYLLGFLTTYYSL